MAVHAKITRKPTLGSIVIQQTLSATYGNGLWKVWSVPYCTPIACCLLVIRDYWMNCVVELPRLLRVVYRVR